MFSLVIRQNDLFSLGHVATDYSQLDNYVTPLCFYSFEAFKAGSIGSFSLKE